MFLATLFAPFFRVRSNSPSDIEGQQNINNQQQMFKKQQQQMFSSVKKVDPFNGGQKMVFDEAKEGWSVS